MIEHLIKELLHEVNLPIATVEANLKLIERDLSSKKSIKRLERAKSAIDRLKRLNRIISYNLKREVLEIERERVNLADIISERVEFFRDLKRNSIYLELEPLIVEIDKIGFEQIIDNLVENAMKYSSKNSPIEIELKDFKLTIKDYGRGMSEAELVIFLIDTIKVAESSKVRGLD